MRKVESNMTVDPLIQSLKGKLVVSVQAYMGEPLRTPETMAQMSRACELGGAAAIRYRRSATAFPSIRAALAHSRIFRST